MQARALNNKGFSLIELLIAVVIIMISMLALLSSMMQSSTTNVENDLRNTANRISNQTAEALLALPLNDAELTNGEHTRVYGNASQNSKGFPISRRTIRNFQKNFTIKWQVLPLTQELVGITVTVYPSDKGEKYATTTTVFKHKAN